MKRTFDLLTEPRTKHSEMVVHVTLPWANAKSPLFQIDPRVAADFTILSWSIDQEHFQATVACSSLVPVRFAAIVTVDTDETTPDEADVSAMRASWPALREEKA